MREDVMSGILSEEQTRRTLKHILCFITYQAVIHVLVYENDNTVS